MSEVHVTATSEGGEPLGSWTTTDEGDHIPDEPKLDAEEQKVKDAFEKHLEDLPDDVREAIKTLTDNSNVQMTVVQVTKDDEQAHRKLAHRFLIGTISRDSEMVAMAIDEATRVDAEFAGMVMVHLSKDFDMIVSEMWGGSAEERLDKFSEMCKKASERTEEAEATK